MQKFDDIKSTDKICNSIDKIMNRDITVLSNNSGTSFPSYGIDDRGVPEGTRFYNTKNKKMYIMSNRGWQVESMAENAASDGKQTASYIKNIFVQTGSSYDVNKTTRDKWSSELNSKGSFFVSFPKPFASEELDNGNTSSPAPDNAVNVFFHEESIESDEPVHRFLSLGEIYANGFTVKNLFSTKKTSNDEFKAKSLNGRNFSWIAIGEE